MAKKKTVKKKRKKRATKKAKKKAVKKKIAKKTVKKKRKNGGKIFLKLNWTIFILFILFNIFSKSSLFELSAVFGSQFRAGLFDIFSCLYSLDCADLWSSICIVWSPVLELSVSILNVLWQFLLANAVVFLYRRAKK